MSPAAASNRVSVGRVIRVGQEYLPLGLRVLLLTLLGCCLAHAADSPNNVANTNQWVVRSWQTKDGLPQNTVYAIAQTRDGYLWIGTDGGLARFDGARFRSFGLRDGLRSIEISSLAEDRDGVLWVGTRGGGFSRWENGHFTTFTQEEGLPNRGVGALAPGEKGTLYLGTARGLAKFHAGVVTVIGKLAGLPESGVRALLYDSRGTLWVSFTLGGLYKGTGGSFERVEETVGASTPVYSLCEDREGYVWAGGGNGYLWKLGNGTSQLFMRTNGVPFQFIEWMAQGKEGPLWLGTRNGGLHCFNGSVFQQVPIGATPLGTTVRSILVDREGTVWVGSRGLQRLSPRLLRVWGATDGLQDRTVTSVAEDGSGRIWVCTQTAGIYRFQDGGFSKVEEPALAGHPYAYTAVATADGAIWAAGESFIYKVQPNGTSEVYTSDPIRNQAIRAMCEDGNGVWMGTYDSTLLKADAVGINVVLPKGTLEGDIRSLAREGPDTLWIGTSAGLYLYERGKLRIWSTRDGLVSGTIQALHRDSDGTLWIGTLGGGLARLKNGRLFTVTGVHGLADDVVSQIAKDDFGFLWLGCNRGIVRLAVSEIEDLAAGRTTSVHTTLLSQSDGMLQEQCTGAHSPTAIRTKTGRLLFPTVDGMVDLDPRQWLATQAVVPQATIDEIRVDGQPSPLTPDLVVPRGSRYMEVTYGAPSLRVGDSIHFRFRLQPLETEWMNAGVRRTAYFSNLRPGRYLFEVVAGSNQGEWNQNSAHISFTIKPYLWQTRWFQLLSILGICGAGVGWFLHRLDRVEQKRAEQESVTRQIILSQEAERKRVASELHDGLNQNLALLSVEMEMFGQRSPEPIQEQLKEFSKQAKALSGEVHRISHGLHPAKLTQLGLVVAVRGSCREVEATHGIKIDFSAQDVPRALPEDVALCLYRVAQEAIQNVVKHSQAKQANLELAVTDGIIRLSITDHGKGFEVGAKRTKASLGLVSMQERVRLVQGEITVASKPGEGTCIEARVPFSTKEPKP